MSAILADFERVFTKLLKLQQADPPPIVWEGVAKLLRFALLGLILLAVFLLVQTVVCACKQQLRNLVVLGLSALAVAAVPVWALGVSLPAAPEEAVLSASVQSPIKEQGALVWGEEVELSPEQTRALEELLAQGRCRRTLRRALPEIEEGMKNLVITMEGGKRYRLLLGDGEAYRYETQDTGFLCRMQQYDTLHSALASVLTA